MTTIVFWQTLLIALNKKWYCSLNTGNEKDRAYISDSKQFAINRGWIWEKCLFISCKYVQLVSQPDSRGSNMVNTSGFISKTNFFAFFFFVSLSGHPMGALANVHLSVYHEFRVAVNSFPLSKNSTFVFKGLAWYKIYLILFCFRCFFFFFYI